MTALRLLVIIIVVLAFNLPVLAASSVTVNPDNYSNVTEITDEALKLNLKIQEQYYPSKKIKVELEIDSSIDSGRTAVDWISDSNILKAENEVRDLVVISKGQKSLITKVFDPQTYYSLKESNNTGIAVKVTAASYDRNYISIKKADIILNKDFEITPLLSSYNSQKNLFQLFSLVLGVIVASVLIVLIVIGIKKFIVYLNTEQEL